MTSLSLYANYLGRIYTGQLSPQTEGAEWPTNGQSAGSRLARCAITVSNHAQKLSEESMTDLDVDDLSKYSRIDDLLHSPIIGRVSQH